MAICNCPYTPPEASPCLHCRRRLLAITPAGVEDVTRPLDLGDGKPSPLAVYIVEFLKRRNAGELHDRFEAMTIRDHHLFLDELTLILIVGGKPPNWGR
jgi:hypothetical protein